ncbi:MAG TPA: hypothetical protein DEG17_09310 [Cyanobacteria bacterium UBA11149]|nr:hypothetical protein [Cyanobacteria bacterium UBA11367]HBE57492.1 hypothetical protein [Cyanobacteria bacterium UBA11366]HBK66395.1 hypothetical protein [Cyanobacteria bacterium UBA11166]HBR73586.1 hypothetical protein [Cyanobacteria bacterium UBA11159]HBS68113.1 hypothetical protein [Cyanobacteria bacterium UBA11153]HBW89048.1 hypothetical protein [Cyanobacteria bacterium UBA11149]HCA96716.1 hypothetical protein [Cyanobacteria bacterium UBA9226]
MEYLITPSTATNWQINASDFSQEIQKQWSDIEVLSITNLDSYYVLECTIKVPGIGQKLDVALHRDGQGISLDGDLADCARFAIWFRSLVAPKQELVFYDQGYNSHIELRAETTESDIIQPFLTLT